IQDAADLSNPDGIASLTGFANLCETLRSLQQATAIAKELAKPKPLPPRKRIAKTPKFVESDTDSDGEVRLVGVKRKADSSTLESSTDIKRFKPSVPSYMPGTSSAELLISKVDALLAAGGSVTRPSLAHYLEVLDKTTRMELFALDISRQTCNSLLQRREVIQQLLASSDPRAADVSLAQLAAVAPLAAAPSVSNEDTIMEKAST
ncbi:hypothetical protein H0H92_013506, partial [Tricholoma furcatifolium]